MSRDFCPFCLEVIDASEPIARDPEDGEPAHAECAAEADYRFPEF